MRNSFTYRNKTARSSSNDRNNKKQLVLMYGSLFFGIDKDNATHKNAHVHTHMRQAINTETLKG